MNSRPIVCAWCSKPLPIPARTGRPRRYCSDTCRDAIRRERNQPIPTTLAAPATETPDPFEQLAAWARTHPQAAPRTAPEDRFASTLVDLIALTRTLTELRPHLPPTLGGLAGQLAQTITRALRSMLAAAE